MNALAGKLVALVLTATPPSIDEAAVTRAFDRLLPDAPKATVETTARAVYWRFPDAEPVFAGVQPRPDPDAERRARYSVSGLNSGWKPSPHVAHILVGMQPGKTTASRLEGLIRFTAMVAAVAEAPGVVGVYWVHAGATHHPRLVAELAADLRQSPPVMLWAGISIAPVGDRISVNTRGLQQQLGLPDLLIEASAQRRDTIIVLSYDIMSYMVERSQAPREGETVGRSAQERLPVRYVPSPANDGTMLLSVDID